MSKIIEKFFELDDHIIFMVCMFAFAGIGISVEYITDMISENKKTQIEIEAIKNGLYQEYDEQAKKVIWKKNQ